MILTIGALKEQLENYPDNLPVRIQTQAGELEGIRQLTIIAGRVVAQAPMNGRAEIFNNVLKTNK